MNKDIERHSIKYIYEPTQEYNDYSVGRFVNINILKWETMIAVFIFILIKNQKYFQISFNCTKL